MIVIWEVVGLKEKPSELLAASTESYFMSAETLLAAPAALF
jgi:hypothetical protein